MTFQQLQYLLAVERTNSFSLAAKEMFVTQSTISNALSLLEKELNCRIFIRSTRGLTLTPEGKNVVVHAQRICESQRLLTSAAMSTKAQLRVTASKFPPAREAFLQIVEEYAHREDVTFSYNEHGKMDMFDRLLYSYTDVTVSVSFTPYDRDLREKARKRRIQCQQLGMIPAAIKIGPGHRLYGQKDVQPRDFAEERMLDGEGRQKAKAGIMLAYVPIDKDKVMVCNEPIVQKELLRRGYGYTIVPIPLREEREADEFRYIPIPGLTYTVNVYTDLVRPMSPEVSRYLELMQQAYARCHW